MVGPLTIALGFIIVDTTIAQIFNWGSIDQERFIREYSERFEPLWEISEIHAGSEPNGGKIYLTSIGQNAFIVPIR